MKIRRKNLVFLALMLVLVLGALLTQSCEKDPIPSNPPVTYAVHVNTIGKGLVEPDKVSGLLAGSSVILIVTPDVGYSLYSIKINGISVTTVEPTDKEFKYTVSNINVNQNIDITFIETDILIFSVKSISEKPWMWTKFDIYRASDDLFLRSSPLSQSEKTDRYYYIYPSMKGYAYQSDGGIRSGNWNLKQRVLQFDSEIVELIELTPLKYVYKAKPIWGSGDNCYVYAIYTFERN